MSEPTWPSVEDATRRLTVLIEDQAATDMAARDLIVVMRELGRVTAELKARDELITRMLLELGSVTLYGPAAFKDEP